MVPAHRGREAPLPDCQVVQQATEGLDVELALALDERNLVLADGNDHYSVPRALPSLGCTAVRCH